MICVQTHVLLPWNRNSTSRGNSSEQIQAIHCSRGRNIPALLTMRATSSALETAIALFTICLHITTNANIS
jgi:hypothetical protein